jgi:hypothetical protein
MLGLPGFFTTTPLGRWETLKVSLKNPKGVTHDRTRDLRSDNQWFNQLSYRATLFIQSGFPLSLANGAKCDKILILAHKIFNWQI